LARKYEIKFLPTLLVFVRGEVHQRLVGMKSKEYLRAALGV
jgi:hypothetical protein